MGGAVGGFPGLISGNNTGVCFYVNESHTFTLPNEIEELAGKAQTTLFDELLDREVQHELEYEGGGVINWNADLCKRLHGRLYPLWNRHNGDCLLDSVLQACYGVFDTDNALRRVMAETLEQFAAALKPRWKEHECLMARALDYRLDDYQLEQDWSSVLALAHQPGASLEQAHIFALCHIFRRPIIVYSVKYVKSFRGENIGVTHFEGVYLPLVWEPQFCFKSPIALGYTRGHFTALVPLDRAESFTYYCNSSNPGASSGACSSSSGGDNGSNSNNNSSNQACGGSNSGVGAVAANSMRSNSNTSLGECCGGVVSATSCGSVSNSNSSATGNSTGCNSSANSSSNAVGAVSNLEFYSSGSEHGGHGHGGGNSQQVFYLPLTNSEGQLLPVHFLTGSEVCYLFFLI
jgi:hypothetical protein